MASSSTTPLSPSPSSSSPNKIAKYDLFHTLAEYLDVHMVVPMMNFHDALGVYDPRDLLNAKLALLSHTNLVNYSLKLMKENEAIVAASSELSAMENEMTERKNAVMDTFKSLEAEAAPLLKILKDAELVETLRKGNEFNLVALSSSPYDVTSEVLDAYFAYGKFHYECGEYAGAAQIFKTIRELVGNPLSQHHQSQHQQRSFQAMWGQLASRILIMVGDASQVNVAGALADLMELQKMLDAKEGDPINPPNPLEQLQLRAWMLHWSLFIFFHSPEGRAQIVDFFLAEKRHRNVIETLCPWLLRYAAAAAIANNARGKKVLRELLYVATQERYEYSDPVTQLLEVLLVDFNFDRALECLRRCEELFKIDYFLAGGLLADFLENARVIIFETYCRLSASVNITDVCRKFGMSDKESEKWVVDMVRNTKMDAKIDLESNRILLGPPQSQALIWQNLIEKNRDLNIRTFSLANGLEQMRNEGLM